MIFCFDIDNTICKTKGTNYKNAKPHKDIIKITLIIPDGSCIDKKATNIENGKIKKNVFFIL